jgi:hypothetical protein
MTDLDLLIIGAIATFLASAGAYVAIRHRANEAPADFVEEREATVSVSSATARQNAQS